MNASFYFEYENKKGRGQNRKTKVLVNNKQNLNDS